jgi:hypothetical protein
MHSHPLKNARDIMVAQIANLAVPRYPISPLPEHHEALGDHAVAFAQIVADYWMAIGEQLAANAYTTVDLPSWATPMADAASDAKYECQRVADHQREADYDAIMDNIADDRREARRTAAE